MTPSYRTSKHILSHFPILERNLYPHKSHLDFQKPIPHFSLLWRTPITVPLCRSSPIILIVEHKSQTTVVAGVRDAIGLKILKTRCTAMMRKAIPTRMTPKTTPPKTPNPLPPPLQILPPKPPPPLSAAHCSSRYRTPFSPSSAAECSSLSF